MADTKISDLPAVTTPASTDEFAVNQGGTSKKVTRAQTHALESGEHLILPQVDEAATPTLTFGDGNTGFYESADNVISISINGAKRMFITAGGLFSAASTGFAIRNLTASATEPPFAIRDDENTGVGSAAADQLSLIAGGKEMLRLVETGTDATDQVIIGPAGVIGAAAAPALAFGDGNTGFFEDGDNILAISIAGVRRIFIDGSSISAHINGGFSCRNTTSSATVPIFVSRADTDTGVGHAAADNLSLIAGGLEAIRAEDPADLGASETSLWLYDDDTGAIVQVTVGIDDSGGAGFKLLRIAN